MMKFLAVVAVLFPLAVQAVDDRIYFVNIGNDLIGIEQTDENLSNSFSIGYQETLAKEVAQYYFDHVENANITYSLNQEIYTPEDLEAHELIEDDRPYAGWTYVKVEAANRVGNDLHIRGIEIGVVGPASGAEFLQREIHNITGSKHPEGMNVTYFVATMNN